ncbi:retrovirus-related pol polyprotein from transposon [Plakobranchus ocellatus]|uniref:Retrovirus-related pol polyprotein from transposon n=1 Tax=Plakobranchus ocellatus TaxID=259542 RepID=A0AAV3X664_9GAST|nr:retrovirus-related pol polyprotein from transposon [Plakobranchus ocellatus]
MVGVAVTRAKTFHQTVTRPLRVPSVRGAVVWIVTVDQPPARGSSDTRTLGCEEDGSKETKFFEKVRGIVYRRFEDPERNITMKQRVVLTSVAHDSIIGSHLGIKRSKEKVLNSFYLPELDGDVMKYCGCIDVCQWKVKKDALD